MTAHSKKAAREPRFGDVRITIRRTDDGRWRASAMPHEDIITAFGATWTDAVLSLVRAESAAEEAAAWLAGLNDAAGR